MDIEFGKKKCTQYKTKALQVILSSTSNILDV